MQRLVPSCRPSWRMSFFNRFVPLGLPLDSSVRPASRTNDHVRLALAMRSSKNGRGTDKQMGTSDSPRYDPLACLLELTRQVRHASPVQEERAVASETVKRSGSSSTLQAAIDSGTAGEDAAAEIARIKRSIAEISDRACAQRHVGVDRARQKPIPRRGLGGLYRRLTPRGSTSGLTRTTADWWTHHSQQGGRSRVGRQDCGRLCAVTRRSSRARRHGRRHWLKHSRRSTTRRFKAKYYHPRRRCAASR